MANYQAFFMMLFDIFIRQVEDYAIYLLDTEGRVLTWNPGAERIKGYSTAEILGKPLSTFYPPEEKHIAESSLRTAAETGHFETESWRVRKDGSRFWGSISLTALRDESGKLRGYAKITQDLTEQKQAEEELRATQLKYDLLMAGVKEYAVFLIDPDGNVIDWNLAAQRLLGYTQEEILGQHLRTFFPPEQHGPEGTPAEVLKTAAAEGRTEEESWHARKDGTLFWGSGITSALRDDSGRLKGFVKILLDRTERKRADEERQELLEAERAARSEAERASLLKDEFLSTLSHELRTPLSTILGWSQILATGGYSSEDLKEGIETISRSAHAQVQLIDDLLDMSRIISGKIRLDVQPTDVAEVVDAAVDVVRPSAEAKGVRLRKVVDPLAGPVNGDPTRLQQVVWNLLTNAVKFTPKGGQIDVSVERVNSHIEITVSDSGSGIAPEFLPHVFERFRQADSSLTRRHGGLGLGLAIVKQLVDLHGGSVRVKSPGEGQGATFSVELPLVPVRDRERQEHPLTPKGTFVPFKDLDLSGTRVLVVDDEPDARALVMRVLKQCHAEVTAAAGADEGLKLLKEFRPDVIMSDIGMPEKDGYTFIREVRQLPAAEGGRTPAVALTAFARSEDRTQAMLAGYQVHIAKPIEPRELVATIASLSGRMNGG